MLQQQTPITRPVTIQDRTAVSNMIHFGAHVHRHLDWRSPLDWIGIQPFEGLEINERLVSVLSCAPDIPGIGWIRTFACEMQNYHEKAWDILWERVEAQLPDLEIETIAAIPIQKWFRDLLLCQNFAYLHNIITLTWDPKPFEDTNPSNLGFTIRQMTSQDLPAVNQIDNQAFDPLWQHSLAMIRLAFDQGNIATVAADGDQLVGYQITTRTQYGNHLGRLAVAPDAQHKGIGLALVNDLKEKALKDSPGRLTVNTHEINHRSIGLYRKSGFAQTRESYPVYQLKI